AWWGSPTGGMEVRGGKRSSVACQSVAPRPCSVTGQGERIEIAMQDAMLQYIRVALSNQATYGVAAKRNGSKVISGRSSTSRATRRFAAWTRQHDCPNFPEHHSLCCVELHRRQRPCAGGRWLRDWSRSRLGKGAPSWPASSPI